jgi:hypothetical protein
MALETVTFHLFFEPLHLFILFPLLYILESERCTDGFSM